MRRKGSTEQVVKRTAMKSEIEAGEPLKPEEVANYECPDKDITDDIEAFGYVLQMAGEGKTVEEYFKDRGFHKWTNEEGKVIIMDSNLRQVNNLIRNYIENNYGGSNYAYVKKDGQEIYGQVYIRPYDSVAETPYGRIIMPITCIGTTPMFFKKTALLTPDQQETYELYHNKKEDYDRMDMEKKIMADLIRYAQIGNKNIEESKTIFDKIEKSCKDMGCISGISFREGVFTIKFDWRMITDSSGSYGPRVAPPFVMKIYLRDHLIKCEGEHPHNLHPNPCLGGELTRIKDKCFRDKDLYGLVMAMVSFGLQWTSTDAGGTDREISRCLARHIHSNYALVDCKNALMGLPVPFMEIMRTLSDNYPDYFLQHPSRSWFKGMLDDDNFVNDLKATIGDDNLRTIFITAYKSSNDRDEEKYSAMVEKYLS